MENYVSDVTEQKELQVLEALKVNSEEVEKAEESTRDQASHANWYHLREKRFTASLNDKLRQRNPKTTRGFQSFAKSLVFGNEKQKKDKVLQVKLSHGRYHEPIALEKYTTYMRMVLSRNILIENCGFVIDKNNYVMGATPDAKITDTSATSLFGIAEVKCTEEYKDIDPKDICYISNEFCLSYDTDTGNTTLNRDHSYYDQVQMQIALSTQTWCDFILYASKGMVIDRIPFNSVHWEHLKCNILKFYFTYMLFSFLFLGMSLFLWHFDYGTENHVFSILPRV